MKLSEYINFRNRGKLSKNTKYNIRTQHFYDGQPMLVVDEEGTGLAYATGIGADFMNKLNIPDAYAIAQEQKQHFLALSSTQAQKDLLMKLNNMMNPNSWNQANIEIDKLITEAIKSLEQAFDKVTASASELKKIKKQTKNANLNSTAYAPLNAAYRNFLDIYQSIKNKRPELATESYIKDLDFKLAEINSLIENDPKVLIDKTIMTQDGKKQSNYINYLAYLMAQIKGISMLEHQGINFIKKHVEIPQGVEFIGSGQILIDGKQAAQDALFFDENLQIVLDNGRKIQLKQYLKELENTQDKTERISFSFNEWNQIQTQALGLQSKYHRGGYIQMGKVKFTEVIDLDMNQARALRYLYILSQGLTGYQAPNEPFENVSHKFNVKAQHEHYKALFSYCLGNFMNKLISHNYFMMTAQGIKDSYSYYVDLFNKGRYFAPIGTVSVTRPREYRIAIRET